MIAGQLPWRPVDLRYKRNEIYIDVIESVNLLMSTAGTLFIQIKYIARIVDVELMSK